MSTDAAFQFNFFGAAQQQEGGNDEVTAAEPPPRPPAAAVDDAGAQEVHRHEAAQALEQPSQVQLDGSIQLLKGRVSSEAAARMLGEPELQDSDLVPSKYEGGFKLWEGAIDLCNFLIQHYQITPDLLAASSPAGQLQGKRVLELGCGHGLPGILCLLAGASVHFQDYNRQVITHLTLPNVQANLAHLPRGTVRQAARYFAGDWAAIGQLLASSGMGGYYDVILAAETIYNQDSQERLLQCIKQVLQPPHGVAYVAAKSFYFGVGGSTTSFADHVRADGILECKQVWKVEDGTSNTREVLRLGFPEAISPFFL